MVDTIRQKLNSLATAKRPAAKALRDRIFTDEKVVRGIVALKAKLKKEPDNQEILEQLAVEYIACGDWKAALSKLKKISGEAAEVADWELSDEKDAGYDAAKVAKFWWGLAEKHSRRKQVAESIKVHSANWYKKALAMNLLTGIDVKVANKRIEEAEGSSAAEVVVERQNDKGLYMVVDFASSGKKAVTYLDAEPKGGWSDDFRMKKLVMRKVMPGSFEYMPGKSFKITKPFYIGVFEVTQKQYEMIAKSNPSDDKGEMRPVERLKYTDIRGGKKGLDWPKNDEVDNDSFLGKLRKRIGLRFDLPTEVQWEYACRAGTKGDFNVDGVKMVKLGKCENNGGKKDHHMKVGSFIPNAWGLYDMHGNVSEWCLDRDQGEGWMEWSANAKETETDPKGPLVGTSRIRRGGRWFDYAKSCRSSQRCRFLADSDLHYVGFRLCCPAEGK